MRNTYKWYLDRKYIERESEKAILVNVKQLSFSLNLFLKQSLNE